MTEKENPKPFNINRQKMLTS